jgi:hypothetical protein
VKMGEEYVFDLELVFGSECQILRNVALRIDDGRDAGFFIADKVRSMGEAIEIELFEDQASPPSLQVASINSIRIRKWEPDCGNRKTPPLPSQCNYRSCSFALFDDR